MSPPTRCTAASPQRVFFSEKKSPLNPSSPYSASKAGGDRLAYSYFKTFGLPVLIARPANNYGPYQYPPEKLNPVLCHPGASLRTSPCRFYGDGGNCRDWLFVRRHGQRAGDADRARGTG